MDIKRQKKFEQKIKEGIHDYSTEKDYSYPDDPIVRENLEWFQDQKLGFMIHWGPYSQLDVGCSWPLSDSDAIWCRDKRLDWNINGETFKRQYFDLNRTFNPIRFDPQKWAEEIKETGAKYLIFTTKHHDGFCMWDTKYSDYKITAPSCPFHAHPYADVCANLFEACRKKGIAIAAYFSKADWHVDSYWSKDGERGNYMDRGPSYDPKKHPEKWEKFVQFTHNQIRELAQNYGRIEIFWFDGGWVCEREGEDIRLGEIVEEIRQYQKGLISVDRTVGGAYENYVTPEQKVPEKPMTIPWESNLTLGTSFSYRFDDTYKSGREVLNLLVDIVAKGGNLAINVGARPNGVLPENAMKQLKKMGRWLEQFGEAIYGTRVCAPYKKDGIAFTRKENKVYAIETFATDETPVQEEVWIPYEGEIKQVSSMETGEKLRMKKEEKGFFVYTPKYEEKKAPMGRVFCLEV